MVHGKSLVDPLKYLKLTGKYTRGGQRGTDGTMRHTRKEIRSCTGRFDTINGGGDLDMSLGVETGAHRTG